MLSFTEENYLKAIYTINEEEPNSASTSAIAQKLDTKPASVSDMLRKLKAKNLIHYKKYQAVNLSEEGKRIAISIIRKHRLWEYFLVEKLNFGWEEVHDIAEQLEHIKSTKLTNELDAFLDFPKADPHGDPIPDQHGNFPKKSSHLLNQLNAEQSAILLGVKDHSTAFLEYLSHIKLELGTLISITRKNEFDGSIEINYKDQIQTISQTIAKNLLVKIKP